MLRFGSRRGSARLASLDAALAVGCRVAAMSARFYWCLGLVMLSTLIYAERPFYIKCQDSTECGVGRCCSIAGNRYSVPACGALQEVGGSCRPDGHRTYNMSLTYPDGATVNFTNIYYLFCACAPGLECDIATSSCQEVNELLDDNYLIQ
uniref:Astakine n=1 Tax=Timema bartmani TaxID=61472 RepID=A0A7R9F4E1_9NEOP|nr:unnamed protein product [Timema bartmani]